MHRYCPTGVVRPTVHCPSMCNLNTGMVSHDSSKSTWTIERSGRHWWFLIAGPLLEQVDGGCIYTYICTVHVYHTYVLKALRRQSRLPVDTVTVTVTNGAIFWPARRRTKNAENPNERECTTPHANPSPLRYVIGCRPNTSHKSFVAVSQTTDAIS